MLLHNGPTTANDLDAKCESFLKREFGLPIDFAAGEALEALTSWGLVATVNGTVTAVPINAALVQLDAVWDNLFSFDVLDGGKDLLKSVASGLKLSMAPTRKKKSIFGGSGKSASTTTAAAGAPIGVEGETSSKKKLSLSSLGIGTKKSEPAVTVAPVATPAATSTL